METCGASPRWRKSSRSFSNGNCVEVASLPAAGSGAVLVRDSKDPDGARLTFTRTEWQAFTAAVRQPGGQAPVPAGSVLGHALRRLAAEQADPDGADPVAGHDSYV